MIVKCKYIQTTYKKNKLQYEFNKFKACLRIYNQKLNRKQGLIISVCINLLDLSI
jgi:hypothetical protein